MDFRFRGRQAAREGGYCGRLSRCAPPGGDLTVGSKAAHGGFTGGAPAEPAHRINGLRGNGELMGYGGDGTGLPN